jgi:2-oxoglutarate ferredoxin oxidoreductase subunit gamma
MGQGLPIKGEVIITGLGGTGVLTTGKLLAEAAMTRYKNVTWFPSFDISKRGGLCECTVIFSDDEIASPLLSQADGVIVADARQFEDFTGRVRPGGTMIVEKAGLEAKTERKDIRIIEVPAIEVAISLSGASLGANLILLGAFIEATQTLSPALIREKIKNSFVSNKKVQKINLRAFEKGCSIIKNLSG